MLTLTEDFTDIAHYPIMTTVATSNNAQPLPFFFPTEVMTNILGFCNETSLQKHQRLWKSIKVEREEIYEDGKLITLNFRSVNKNLILRYESDYCEEVILHNFNDFDDIPEEADEWKLFGIRINRFSWHHDEEVCLSEFFKNNEYWKKQIEMNIWAYNTYGNQNQLID